MRRKRRNFTQTIRKKRIQPSASTDPFLKKRRFPWGRIIFYLIIAVAVVWGMYMIYTKNFQPQQQMSTVSDSLEISESPSQTSQTSAPFEQAVQIEILNGCGVNGIAKVFQSYLRDHGFDVVNTENYTEDGKIRWDVPDSKIINKTADRDEAEQLATILKIPAEQIIYEEDPNAIYDMSVIIGLDYKNLLGTQ